MPHQGLPPIPRPPAEGARPAEDAARTATPIHPAVALRSSTSDQWTRTALSAIDELLDDHCQCELKAASNALALVGRNPQRDELVRSMSALAREEMDHYRLVRRVLIERGGKVSRLSANPYVKGLNRHRLGGANALLDDLLICAIVESRSCERFVCLGRGLRAMEIEVEGHASLADLYDRLARSESGHATLFVDLARRYYPAERVARELARRLELEAEVLEELPLTPQMHGGQRLDLSRIPDTLAGDRVG